MAFHTFGPIPAERSEISLILAFIGERLRVILDQNNQERLPDALADRLRRLDERVTQPEAGSNKTSPSSSRE
jgi:hypothetical protein